MSRLAWRHLELLDQIGEGHSGVVYKARLLKEFGAWPANAIVAVKRYKSWVMEEPGQMDRGFGEIEVGRLVNHPNVARVIASVLDDNGRPSLIMQYCAGETVDALMTRNPTFSDLGIDVRFRILGGLAAGLAALHAHGIIHRDVKPANIMLTPDGPVLTDFGVIKSNALPQQTTAGAFLGTVRYAAPEYIFGYECDGGVDVYGFGAVAYELLTRERLYANEHHWARIVAAKARPWKLRSGEFVKIPLIAGWNVASLIFDMLKHSLCRLPERDLDLGAFASAVSQNVWEGEFSIDTGRLSLGEKRFSESYVSARTAAVAIQKHLSSTDRNVLASLLSRHYWSVWAPVKPLRSKRIQRYVDHRFAEYKPTTNELRFVPAVREAFALGMIVGTEPEDWDDDEDEAQSA